MNSPVNKSSSFFQQIEALRVNPEACETPVLILAAHPDDESIGASVVVRYCVNCTVVFLTDGAPKDGKFWSQTHPCRTREEYAALRHREAVSVLSSAGIGEQRVLCLGAVDQESIFISSMLIDKLTNVIQAHQPEYLITHSYEGGHPDHDTAALVAHIAIELARADSASAPNLLEMTSYHAREGQCVTGEFLPTKDVQEFCFQLSPEEARVKRQMLMRYESQREVLKYFSVHHERLRPAPAYDFSKPPHAGKLWYECLGWPMTGERWRERAAHAIARARLPTLENICA